MFSVNRVNGVVSEATIITNILGDVVATIWLQDSNMKTRTIEVIFGVVEPPIEQHTQLSSLISDR